MPDTGYSGDDTPFKYIRSGVSALTKAKTLLLDSRGVDRRGGFTDSIIQSDASDFYELVGGMGYGQDLMARVIADAALVERLPSQSPLYVEGLAYEAERIPNGMGTTYGELPNDERIKLASFLFRPADERPLTMREGMNVMYPNFVLEMREGVRDVDWVLTHGRDGLRKLLRSFIETGGLDSPSEKEVARLWESKRWDDYVEPSSPDQEAYRQRYPDGEEVRGDVVVADFNLPAAIIYLLSDVRDFLDEETRDLKEILDAAEKVMPHRKRLHELQYFHGRSDWPDRSILLDKIFNDEPLM